MKITSPPPPSLINNPTNHAKIQVFRSPVLRPVLAGGLYRVQRRRHHDRRHRRGAGNGAEGHHPAVHRRYAPPHLRPAGRLHGATLRCAPRHQAEVAERSAIAHRCRRGRGLRHLYPSAGQLRNERSLPLRRSHRLRHRPAHRHVAAGPPGIGRGTEQHDADPRDGQLR